MLSPAAIWVRASGPLAILVLTGPILAGLVWVTLPAFGHLPALGRTDPSLEPWRDLWTTPGIGRMVTLSVTAGLATPLAALLITCLFLAGWSQSRAFVWMRRAISPILSIPHAAAAFGLAFLIAPSGLIARVISPWVTGWQRPPDLLIVQDTAGLAMMAGLVVKEVPFLMLVALAALPQIDAGRRLMVARGLGYAPLAAWFKTVFPALYPLIRLPIFAVIAYSSANVEIALILGPGTPPTLAVAILRWLNDPDLALRLMASAGALTQAALTLGCILLWWLGERLVSGLGRFWIEGGTRTLADRTLAMLGLVGMLLVGIGAFGGLLALTLWSFAEFWRFPDLLPQGWGLRSWMRLGGQIGLPLWHALAVGVLSTGMALILVTGALENEIRRGRGIGWLGELILYLPLVVPGIAFLFGLVLAGEAAGLKPGMLTVAFGHLIFVLPYVYLSLSEAYRRLDPRWSALARSLGQSPMQTFLKVRLPLLSQPVLTAFAVGFAVSIGQYLATQLLGAGRVPTVTTEAVALAAGGDRRVIAVWALMQALLPALAFALATGLPWLLWRNRRGMRGTLQ